MKRKIEYIIIPVIAILIAIFTINYLKQNNMQEIIQIKKSTKILGKPDTNYIKGKDSLITKPEEYHNTDTLQINKTDSAFTKTDSTADYKLKIKIKTFGKIDSISMDYFLNLKPKSFIRIDTLKIFRVDTLKITKLKIKKIKNPFYNTFWFGAAITSLIVLIINLIH